MTLPGYDAAKTQVRIKQLEKLLEAHNITDDRETAVALLVMLIHRLVNVYGPVYLSGCVSMFIDLWRHVEAKVVMGALQSLVTEEILKAVTTDDTKH